MKISIIIPVYNAEKRIIKCIKSVQKQTYKNFEIICVNDGSNDKTQSILEKLKVKDDRIVVVNQENKGVFLARKTGIKNARGSYIMFLDADDEFATSQCIEFLVCKLKENSNVQIVQFGYKNVRFGVQRIKIPKKIGIIDADYFKKNFYEEYIGSSGQFQCFSVQLWAKIYKTSIVKEAVDGLYTKLRMGEDLYLNLAIMDQPDFENLLVIPDVLYKYNVGIGASSRMPDTILEEYSELKKYQLDMCEKWGLCEHSKYCCNVETIYYRLNIVKNMIFSQYADDKIIEYLLKSKNYECIRLADEYFLSRPKEELYDELLFFVNATPNEYLEYVKNKFRQSNNIFKKLVRHISKVNIYFFV